MKKWVMVVLGSFILTFSTNGNDCKLDVPMLSKLEYFISKNILMKISSIQIRFPGSSPKDFGILKGL